MPQAALIAGIGAAAQVGSAVVGSRAASGAQKAQLKANQEAMNYERQRQAEDQKRRDAAAEAYRQSWLQWYARNGDEGVRRYGVPVGIQIPSSTGKSQGPAVRMEGSTVAPPSAAPMGGASMPAPAPVTAPLGGVNTPPAGNPMTTPQTPQVGIQPVSQPQQGATSSLSGWEDWNRYGIGA